MLVKEQNYLEEPITWNEGNDPEYPYFAVFDGNNLVLRLNDFPDEHLYSLIVGNKELASFDDWPRAWTRRQSDKEVSNKSFAASSSSYASSSQPQPSCGGSGGIWAYDDRAETRTRTSLVRRPVFVFAVFAVILILSMFLILSFFYRQ